jgi:beta-glucosidase
MRAASVAAAAGFAALLAAASPRAAAAQACAAGPTDTAYTGLDVAYALVASPGACCSQCASTPLCAAYTWVPDAATAGGRCFLKTAAASPTALPGAVSGTLTAGAPSSCAFGLVPCAAGASKGACALFADWCASAAGCAPGTPICPDGRTCSSSAGGWDGCPPSTLPGYLNVSLPVAARLAALVPQLSLAEIAPQLNNPGYGAGPPGPPGIERLAVPPYNWLNEGLHGFARAGLATSFPQISVVGQTFNRTVFGALGRVLGIEARAKYAMDRRSNSTAGDYTGVTLYAPNINIGRDPRWGRLQEVVSEDPYLTAQYAHAAVRAAQAPLTDADATPKIYACCKHAVAYSFEEYKGIARSAQNAVVTGRDLLEVYLPAFQTCIRDAGGKSVMASYNAVNGVPTVASAFLLNTTIRGRYGFSGSSWVMSDYSAILDTYSSHKYCTGPDANDTCTALALHVGTDQDGGGNDYARECTGGGGGATRRHVTLAPPPPAPALSTTHPPTHPPAEVPRLVEKGLLTEAEVRTSASRLFQVRLELGLLDPPQAAPYAGVTPLEWLDTDAHRALSYEAAQQGMVLLKNEPLAAGSSGTGGGAPVLPLDASKLNGATVAVIGPNADE